MTDFLRRLRDPRPIDLVGWVLFYALILGALYLQRHPIELGPSSVPETPGSAFPDTDDRAPALLLVAAAGSYTEERSFDETLWDHAWGNFLAQEFGPYRVASLDRLGELDLSRVGLIVVSRGCGELPPDAFEALDSFAIQGGVVVHEVPGPLRTDPHRVTWVDPGLLGRAEALALGTASIRMTDPSAMAHPGGSPEEWQTLVRAGPTDEVHLSLISIRHTGQGGWMAVRFPFATQLTEWQQGRPADDFSIPDRHRDEAGVPFCQPNALVPDARFLDTLFPHADAMERVVAAGIETIRPVPRLWYFPYASDGVYLLTHDDENFGDRSIAITEEESRQGYRATMFVIPDRITERGAGIMQEQGAEIALHWWRGWTEHLTRRVGIFGWTPIRRDLSLTEQRDHLLSLVPGSTLESQRVHGLMWEPHYTRDFRRLEAAGFRLDSTYGPTGPGQLGYVFGTGFPFHPLDTNGLPFALREVPFLYQDDENWYPELDRQLLTDSQRSYHEVVVPLYHCTTMNWKPSVEILDGWLRAAETARERNHWVTSLEEYHRFWVTRLQSPLRTDGAGAYEVADAADNLALMVPEGVLVNGARTSSGIGRRVSVMGRTYRLIPLVELGGTLQLEARP